MNKLILLLLGIFIFSAFIIVKPTDNKKQKNDNIHEYINKYKNVAIEEHRLYCIPASVTLAQGILESASGQSTLVKKTNNHFGVKCFGNCNNKNSYMMEDDKPDDRFVKYKSPWWSYRHHSKVLQNGRYQKCFKCGDDYKCWAKQLKKCGYATSKTYTQKLIRIIETYKLYKYDR
jgi:flagellum-specific peptidoglycan hydrolase FlgJ